MERSISPILLQHRALVLESVAKNLSGVHIKTLPTPEVEAGSAIVHIVAAGVLSYHRDIYDGERDYPIPKPAIGGFSAIGRVAAVGRDAVALQPGNLVYVDSVLRGRDDLNAFILSGVSDGFNDRSHKLMENVWRDGTFDEYAKFPLESCIPLDEDRLCRGLGYSLHDLSYMGYMLVSFGGLRDIRLEAGETIVVAPATGGFGGAGVLVAAAMGARVVAMVRNEQKLASLKARVLKGIPHALIETVQMTGDEAKDTAALQKLGTIDAVLDFTPPAAIKSPHLSSAIKALRCKGRVSLMGSFSGPLPPLIPKDLTIKGKFMYERDDMLQFVKMLERGLFPTGSNLVDVKSFPLDEWKAALDEAAEYMGLGKYVVISP